MVDSNCYEKTRRSNEMKMGIIRIMIRYSVPESSINFDINLIKCAVQMALYSCHYIITHFTTMTSLTSCISNSAVSVHVQHSNASHSPLLTSLINTFIMVQKKHVGLLLGWTSILSIQELGQEVEFIPKLQLRDENLKTLTKNHRKSRGLLMKPSKLQTGKQACCQCWIYWSHDHKSVQLTKQKKAGQLRWLLAWRWFWHRFGYHRTRQRSTLWSQLKIWV